MKKNYVRYVGCQECGHQWLLKVDVPIIYFIYWAWLASVASEHIIIMKRIKHND